VLSQVRTCIYRALSQLHRPACISPPPPPGMPESTPASVMFAAQQQQAQPACVPPAADPNFLEGLSQTKDKD